MTRRCKWRLANLRSHHLTRDWGYSLTLIIAQHQTCIKYARRACKQIGAEQGWHYYSLPYMALNPKQQNTPRRVDLAAAAFCKVPAECVLVVCARVSQH